MPIASRPTHSSITRRAQRRTFMVDWDTQISALVIPGDDLDSPPRTGDRVSLTYNGYDYEVIIKEIAGDTFKGEVTSIGPTPILEANGIRRGDEVVFKKEHIDTLFRQ